MTPQYWIVAFVVAQRVGELVYARRNTRRLLAAGGVEIGARHYPFIVLLHTAWLLAVLLAAGAGELRVVWLGIFVALQVTRLWVLASLGPYWTTRIITVPDAPVVRRGPYRFCRHPNYLVVVGEIAVLPLVFGAWPVALIFSAFNLPLLAYRVRVEDAALATRRETLTPEDRQTRIT